MLGGLWQEDEDVIKTGRTKYRRGLAEQLSPPVLLFYPEQHVHLYGGKFSYFPELCIIYLASD